MDEVRGLILAAGLGTRLRPLTDHIPKPLLPVAGETLLDRAAMALTSAGCQRLVVNAHYLASQVAEHLEQRSDSERFYLSKEPEILGTGGALHGARSFLSQAETVVVYNGDVLSDLKVEDLLEAHRASGAMATLALVDWPEVNSVLLDAEDRIIDMAGRLGVCAGDTTRSLTFTGIACYRREFLDLVPEGPSDLISILNGLIKVQPGSIRGFVHPGHWEDLGTLSRYLGAQRQLLGHGFVSPGPLADAHLDECVLLDNATVPAGTSLHNAVVGDHWAVVESLENQPGLELAMAAGFEGPLQLEWITGHGSDRRFLRLVQGDRQAVLMQSPPEDSEFQRFLSVSTFLYDRGLGTAAIYAQDPQSQTVLMEDLGRDTLETLLLNQPYCTADLASRVLDRLADLQTFGTEARGLCPSAWDRSFDHEHLRWETDYFRTRFLVGHAGFDADSLSDLDGEFESLAQACLRQPRTLVHRDFQSQNILLKDGMVRLVDVQGMRWGPMAYDVASMLFDPYIDLEDGLRDELLTSFPARIVSRGGETIAHDDWLAMTTAASLQRLMQALGAYGFLGHVKGRTSFLSHIPCAVKLLEKQLRMIPELGESRYSPPTMPHTLGYAVEIVSRPSRH